MPPSPYTRAREALAAEFSAVKIPRTRLTPRAHVKRCKRTGKTTETVFEDLLSTPHAHYRLFVYSTRTIKINIFRERVGAQVFPHSDFPEGRGGYAITCRRGCRCSSTLASSASCLPYRLSFACSTEGRRAPAFAPPVRPATLERNVIEFPAVACCRVPPSMAVLLSLSGLHRRPSVRT